MTPVATLLQAITRDPGDDTAWLALADALTEAGQETRAELVRVQLGLRRSGYGDPAALERRLIDLWTLGVTPCLPRFDGPAGLEFHLIPPGTFWRGSDVIEGWRDPDEQPRRPVTISRGFYLGTATVTRKQWAALTGDVARRAYERTHPVVEVSRGDCEAVCAQVSELLNLRCRLPTEAEWEYACRAGTTTAYFGGDDVDALRRVGWCSYDGEWDSALGSRATREFAPNAFGLYDMHGNVWEWCADWYAGDYYQHAPAVDPPGPAEGVLAVIRGGSYRGGPWFCRSAERREIEPTSRDENVGVRLVVELE